MKTVAGLLMIANGALFFFGGVQHAGASMGRFYEPLIIPAAIVEFLCGLCLLLGAIALFLDWRMRWRIALTTNLVALENAMANSVDHQLGCLGAACYWVLLLW